VFRNAVRTCSNRMKVQTESGCWGTSKGCMASMARLQSAGQGSRQGRCDNVRMVKGMRGKDQHRSVRPNRRLRFQLLSAESTAIYMSAGMASLRAKVWFIHF